jgi:hypothetical protein
MRIRIATVALAFAAIPTADAGILVVSAGRDATIYSESGSLANGAGQYFHAGRTNAGALRRSLLHFDLSSIPDDAVIVSASLRLNLMQAATGTATVSLHRALGAWTTGSSDPSGNEGSGTAAVAGDVTWLSRSFGTGEGWTVSGGDFAAVASAATGIGTELGWYRLTFTSLADLQAMVADPTLNHGWFLLGDETANQTARRFGSADGPTEFAPTLEIEWVAVPAPGAALPLLALGFRRRRR